MGENVTIYEFRCRTCFHIHLSKIQAQSMDCASCPDGNAKRVYSVNVHRPMPDHFNQTTQTQVGSMRQFRDDLKRKSDDYFTRTGIESNFVPHDSADAKALGATNAGLDTTNERRAKNGLAPVQNID